MKLKRILYTKCQLKGAQFLHLACQRARLAPLPLVSYATADKVRCSEASRFSITKIWYA